MFSESRNCVPFLRLCVPHGILRTSSQPQFAGCPRTVLGCPTWDPPDIQSTPVCRDVPGRPSWDSPDIQSTPVCRMSQDCPRTSLMGSSGHPVNPSLQDVPGLSQDCPRTSLVGSSRHPVNPSLQDVSQDVPHGILRVSSQPQFAGCPRNVLGMS